MKIKNPYSPAKASDSWNNSHRISFFEYLYVFVLIIYAGRANIYVESLYLKDNPVGAFIPILLSGILALKWKVKYDARFYLLIFGLAIYLLLAISIKYRDIQPTFFLMYFFSFFIVYVSIKALRFNLFKIFEYLLYILSIIGLLVWSIQTILGGDNFYYLLSKIPGIDLFSNVSGNGFNVIVYSVQPSYASLLYDFTIPRNCGYAWEPGAFAVYICLAIFINLFFFDSDKNGKLRFWVLVVALLSTQSTTGYLIFMVLILYYILNKNLKIVLLLLPIAVILVIYLSSLPFMSKKVIELIDETKGIDQLLEESYGREISATPQRFTSFLIAFKDFQNNPILGVAGHKEETWTYKIGSNISAISGIGNLLAQFGLVGFIFYVVLSFKDFLFFLKIL